MTARPPGRGPVLRGRLFDGALPPRGGERMDTLVEAAGTRVIRIVSAADAPPADYLQEEDEWVALLAGEATLIVAGEDLSLVAGDWLFLPVGVPHTVARTSEGAVWLAVHVDPHPRS